MPGAQVFRGGREFRTSFGRRGQAATEYIHTYGWILLSVMALGGVLFYYNISAADDLLPVECSFLSGLECLGADVEGNLVSMVVVNQFGFTMSNITANITGTCDSSANTSDGNPYGNLNVLLPNQQALYVFVCQNLSGMGIDERVVLGYRNLGTGQEHIKIGKLQYSPTE